jgi:hypothetical protein
LKEGEMEKNLKLFLSIIIVLTSVCTHSYYSSGGQDAGNGGGFVVYENETIFYDFHTGHEVFNPSNWQDKADIIENNILLHIDSFGFNDKTTEQFIRSILRKNASSILNVKRLSLVFYYIDTIEIQDKQFADTLKELLENLRWVDSFGLFELVPYCTLRSRANMDRGFAGAFDNDRLNDRCDVYPVAYNQINKIYLNSKFFKSYTTTNIDLVGLILHEVLQSYVSLVGDTPKKSRFFLSEVVKTLIIKNDAKTAVQLLKRELR